MPEDPNNPPPEYYGPRRAFIAAEIFGLATAICEIENIKCRPDPYDNTIHFKNVEEEERFSIAWGRAKAVAGL
jgi:hypothetical protein